ncbi:hypothetical protein H257_00248 [Aphanomyces astaci]|uniref:Tc1-like transposase DDE domain-containing protein n=1 Tax=Aphanomyces astaci TaxID=112090 RepID=W4HBT3_APHAT|nr:hypothetical protein H257_00248 [Aphanomyces astaci]ETV88734.1 hypothetical protein H257_00248 [Aphanomyces astaci]|eukprot:XP_009821134.1 hypothetical protein H257_00248 [Aphanomyces astaci]
MDGGVIARMKKFVKMRPSLREKGCSDVSGVVAGLLGHGARTVKAVMAEFLATGDVSVSLPPSNTTNHQSRVPNTRAVRALVKRFIRDRCVTRTRTVAKDVLALLQDNQSVTVDEEHPKDYAACLRAVQVFLAKQGYARGSNAKQTYRVSKAHEQARDAYVEMMVPTVTSAPRRPVVYLDESFIHHHYTSHADSLYDPTDQATKPKHKGRRYCFVAAILDDGSDTAHLLGLDIFVGGKKNGKVVNDYHSMFNHDYFVDWFGKLIDEVEELGWSSAVFVMDNAKYHKGKPKTTPKGTWRKEALYQACVGLNITDVSPTDLKTTIWKRLKKHLDEHVLPVVCEMAKGTVGRQYTSTTTFQDVRDRLERAFIELDSNVIQCTIAASTAKLLELNCALRTAEDTPEGSDSDNCTDVSSSSASSSSDMDD